MAEQDGADLSDEEENSLLIACADSYENHVGCLESSELEASEFVENPDGSYEFKEPEKDNGDFGSTNGIDCSESSIASLQQIIKPVLKGSDLLRIVRPGYIWVSDLSSQVWCEMQMYYNLTLPRESEDNAETQIGSSIHLARELAVQDQVPVLTESKEDNIGLKVLNLLMTIDLFHRNGTIAREIPIFGAPFGKDLFVVGIIDELRFNPDTYTIDLVELKTRKTKTVPQQYVKTQHRLQVMLYRKLFDDLVKGSLRKKTIAEKFGIDLQRSFGADLMTHMTDSRLVFENLDQLLDYMLCKVQSLTCISDTYVEYVHQNTMEPIAKEKVVYSEVELSHFFGRYSDFWLGKRDPVGVDIEEAYKCQMCDHAQSCDWRDKKNAEYAEKNRTKRITS